MSLQVFLQAHLIGGNDFLAAEPATDEDQLLGFQGRCAWLTLFCEVLPRALLAELKLSRMLLGSASAEQFLLVLTEEDLPRANELLARAAAAIADLSGDHLRLIWASTEDLGAWPVVRKRLDDVLLVFRSAPLSREDSASAFAPAKDDEKSVSPYFFRFAAGIATASSVGWSPETPGELEWNGGQYSWPLKEQSSVGEGVVVFPRRIATDDEGQLLRLQRLAERAEGRSRWGILIGDVDSFDALLRSAATVEEHIHRSVMFKEFFAGELSLLGTLPDFWRKVTVSYLGGDEFAVIGSWDALLLLARELQRLFDKFAGQNVQGPSGFEGKSISMSLAIAPEDSEAIGPVLQTAVLQLRQAKAAEPGTFSVFGRALEWKRLADAEELKASLVRLVRDFGYSPQYIYDLASVYREGAAGRSLRRKAARVDKPWRTYMRLAKVIPQSRGKELNNVRNAVINSLIGKRTSAVKLRPSGRVGLEWARLATDEGGA
ncbi:MAG: Cas10/Cmr2 second palm domain-containing protein [Bryobacteraceae bacterium]